MFIFILQTNIFIQYIVLVILHGCMTFTCSQLIWIFSSKIFLTFNTYLLTVVSRVNLGNSINPKNCCILGDKLKFTALPSQSFLPIHNLTKSSPGFKISS